VGSAGETGGYCFCIMGGELYNHQRPGVKKRGADVKKSNPQMGQGWTRGKIKEKYKKQAGKRYVQAQKTQNY